MKQNSDYDLTTPPNSPYPLCAGVPAQLHNKQYTLELADIEDAFLNNLLAREAEWKQQVLILCEENAYLLGVLNEDHFKESQDGAAKTGLGDNAGILPGYVLNPRNEGFARVQVSLHDTSEDFECEWNVVHKVMKALERICTQQSGEAAEGASPLTLTWMPKETKEIYYRCVVDHLRNARTINQACNIIHEAGLAICWDLLLSQEKGCLEPLMEAEVLVEASKRTYRARQMTLA